MLTTGAAAGAALAGCTSEDDPAGKSGGDEGPTATPTPTAPTLETFAYPDGASQDGVDGSTLATTHRDAVTGAGSMTLELSETRAFDEFTDSKDYVKRWESPVHPLRGRGPAVGRRRRTRRVEGGPVDGRRTPRRAPPSRPEG